MPPRSSERSTKSLIPIATGAGFAFLVCYFRSFIFPAVPVVLWGDQVGFFADGSRIVSGQLPYRDYFQIVPPGTDLTYALLVKCFGWSGWIPNLAMVFLAAAMAWLIVSIAQRLMVGPDSLLPALLFTGFVLYGGLDPTHHWFSTIAVMAAMLVLSDGINFSRVVAAGALCGVAACYTQTKGAAAVGAFLTYLVWKTWRDAGAAAPVNADARAGECGRKCLVLCSAAAGVFFGANAYFIRTAGLKQWLYCTIVYPLRYYPAPTINNWRVLLYDFRGHGGAGRWITYPFMYATVPLVYLVFLLTMRRQWKNGQNVPWNQLLLLTLTGLGMFLAVASAPSMKRISTVSAPAMILLVWLVNRLGRSRARVKTLLLIAALALAVVPALHTQFRWRVYLNLPAGRMALVDPILYEEYVWMLAHTHPGEFFFGMPPFYTPFHLRNPAATESIDPTEYTRPEQVAALVRALESNPVPVLILRQSAELLHPARASSDHLDPFRAYLLKNYHLTRTFQNGDDVWQKI
jgi:hypothetical protein